MSPAGSDDRFVSARDRDLRPLLDKGAAELDLCRERRDVLHALLAGAWISGTRSGHAKLMNQAIRHREEDAGEAPLEPAQLGGIEAELKALMEASADVLELSEAQATALWELLSQAWLAGLTTYESEVMASLIERNFDIAEEAARWLRDGSEGP